MQELCPGYIVHRTPRRLRLQVPSRRHESSFFAALQRRLSACEGIVAVEANPVTASIVINHVRGFDFASLSFPAFGLAVDAGPMSSLASGCRPIGERAIGRTDIGWEAAAFAIMRPPAAQLVEVIMTALLRAVFEAVVPSAVKHP
jgi:hypothetical protein